MSNTTTDYILATSQGTAENIRVTSRISSSLPLCIVTNNQDQVIPYLGCLTGHDMRAVFISPSVIWRTSVLRGSRGVTDSTYFHLVQQNDTKFTQIQTNSIIPYICHLWDVCTNHTLMNSAYFCAKKQIYLNLSYMTERHFLLSKLFLTIPASNFAASSSVIFSCTFCTMSVVPMMVLLLLDCTHSLWCKWFIGRVIRIIDRYSSNELFMFYVTHGAVLTWINCHSSMEK